MATILNLETATKTCSVALAIDGEVKALKELTSEQYSHAEKLNLFIIEVMNEAGVEMNDLSAVAVSAGPGSYTGLRIGTSTAKGLCYSLEIPLIAIDSLKALASLTAKGDHLICPMFDARRMEVFSAVYDRDLNVLEPTEAVVLDKSSYEKFLSDQKVLFCGPGAGKFKAICTSENAIFDLDTAISCSGMAKLSYKSFLENQFEDVAYFEPAYLKDFVAGKPKKLV